MLHPAVERQTPPVHEQHMSGPKAPSKNQTKLHSSSSNSFNSSSITNNQSSSASQARLRLRGRDNYLNYSLNETDRPGGARAYYRNLFGLRNNVASQLDSNLCSSQLVYTEEMCTDSQQDVSEEDGEDNLTEDDTDSSLMEDQQLKSKKKHYRYQFVLICFDLVDNFFLKGFRLN
jgi:hypothetical protein